MADIEVGLVVYSSDGEKLGKLVRSDGDLLVVEKGFFFPEDYAFRRSDVESASDGEIRLSLTGDELRGQSTQATSTESRRGPAVGERSESVRVPVAEEQLEIGKRARQAGSVRVNKQVREEQKQVIVPVRKEEVRVERVPPSSSSSTDARIEGGRVEVPVVEEEVVVSKRPVVREEVRISKQPIEEQRRVSETVRREEVEIEDDRDEGRRSYASDPAATHDR